MYGFFANKKLFLTKVKPVRNSAIGEPSADYYLQTETHNTSFTTTQPLLHSWAYLNWWFNKLESQVAKPLGSKFPDNMTWGARSKVLGTLLSTEPWWLGILIEILKKYGEPGVKLQNFFCATLQNTSQQELLKYTCSAFVFNTGQKISVYLFNYL